MKIYDNHSANTLVFTFLCYYMWFFVIVKDFYNINSAMLKGLFSNSVRVIFQLCCFLKCCYNCISRFIFLISKTGNCTENPICFRVEICVIDVLEEEVSFDWLLVSFQTTSFRTSSREGDKSLGNFNFLRLFFFSYTFFISYQNSFKSTLIRLYALLSAFVLVFV